MGPGQAHRGPWSGLDEARQWGLYISSGRGKTSTGVEEPALFSEPGLYPVRPAGTLYFGTVQTMPFARPRFADIRDIEARAGRSLRRVDAATIFPGPRLFRLSVWRRPADPRAPVRRRTTTDRPNRFNPP